MIRALVWMALLAVGAYIGYQYAAPHVRAWRFRDAMTQTARLAAGSEAESMRESLLDSATDLGIPLAPDRLRIEGVERGDVRIAAGWEEVVTVGAWKLGEWVDTLEFAYEVGER
ncbi:MAG TPA: hypothetical protein VM737_07000 [Gemmatimonadota bacterium]|nr:hypothetical protein [Gemmatimonadota bacterium]